MSNKVLLPMEYRTEEGRTYAIIEVKGDVINVDITEIMEGETIYTVSGITQQPDKVIESDNE